MIYEAGGEEAEEFAVGPEETIVARSEEALLQHAAASNGLPTAEHIERQVQGMDGPEFAGVSYEDKVQDPRQ